MWTIALSFYSLNNFFMLYIPGLERNSIVILLSRIFLSTLRSENWNVDREKATTVYYNMFLKYRNY
jgi:hypothetical protein